MTAVADGVPPATVRLDALTGLRWWAAFMVFVFHTRVFAPLPQPFASVFDQGYLGVTFFFVLSGFVLTWSWNPALSTSTFYWRRFARIWPATMVALILAIPVFYAIGWGQPSPEYELKPLDIGILLLSVLLLQGWSRVPVVFFSGNPAAWTLTFEAFFYSTHPFVMRLLRRFTVRAALGSALVIVVGMFAVRFALTLQPDSWLAAVPGPVSRLSEFVLGMTLAWALRCGWRPRLSPLLGVSSVVITLVGVAACLHVPSLIFVAQYNNELFTAASGCAIIALASSQLRGRNSRFASRWQVKLGEWSFAFYLVHATLIYAALRVFGVQGYGWLNVLPIALVLGAAIVAAWALHQFVERPAEARLRRWKDARDRARLVGQESK